MSNQPPLHRINLSRMWQVVCIEDAGTKPVRFDLASPPANKIATIERQFNTPTNLVQSVVKIVFSNFPPKAEFELNGSELGSAAETKHEQFVAEVSAILKPAGVRSGNLIRVNAPDVENWPTGMNACLEIETG